MRDSSQAEVSYGLDLDPRRLARDVWKRHIVHLDNAHAGLDRAGGHGLRGRLRLRLVERLLAADLVEREHPLHLSADLGDCGADRVRHGEVVGTDESGGPGELVAEKNAAAADD